MRSIRLVILLVAMTGIGCSVDFSVDVRSNTSWSGYFADRSVEGSGNKTVDLPGDPPQCVTVQKDTEEGYLEIQIKESGGWFLSPTTDYNPIRTTAAYGIVSDCTER